MDEQVILVDETDVQVGTMEKMEAHQKGILHRAFSIFIFNGQNELLLQQRAKTKYHSGGLWTNTCCSHQREGETNLEAANRRLKEEMGMECDLHYGFSFIYRAEIDNGLTEHELDHVLFGSTNQLPVINHVEVESYQYVTLAALEKDIKSNPKQYTAWLKICLEKVIKYQENKNGHTA